MLTSDRVEYALVFAAMKHEDQVVAALLHDTVEDCGGLPVLHEIRNLFGAAVAQIVDALTDSYGQDKDPWDVRKRRYVERLADESKEIRLVATCDKLHNARAVLRDYEEIGERLWERFTGRRDGSLWYYRSVADVLSAPGDVEPAAELDKTVSRLEDAAAEPDPDSRR
jgi:GTP pyrophosphokinase